MADDLLATGIDAGVPTLGLPTLSQVHALAAAELTSGVPLIGAPGLAVHLLEACDLVAGAPVLGQPKLVARVPFNELLPPNSTGLERSLEFPTKRLVELQVLLRNLWRWDTCPVDLLPWLAWAMSVDLWSHDWPVEKKRAIIRDSFGLHRRKGTLWAIERYLSFADAPLRKAVLPPSKPFPGRTMTEAERRAWLERFPQIRIFRFRDRGKATFGAFTRGAFKLEKSFLGAGPAHSPPSGGTANVATFFPYQTGALERYGRRAFLWDRGPHFLATGEETPLRWVERTRATQQGTAYDYEQALIPGSAVQSLFLGQFARGNRDRKDGRWFPIASTARTRIVTVRRASEYTDQADVLQQFAVYPALQPIHAFPEHVAERGTSKRGIHMFGGVPGRWLDPETKERKRIKGFLQGYLPETTAPLRLYDRLHLHDPRRAPDGRPPAIYMGHFRLGQPAFTAELSIEVRGKRSNYEFGRFVYGHLTTGDRRPLELARKAVQRSMARRDKILLKTALHRPITTADGIRAGSGFRSGSLVLSP